MIPSGTLQSFSAANMRNLIYVAVIVHVAFTAAGLELQGKEVCVTFFSLFILPLHL